MSEDLERKQQAERFTVLDLASTPEKPFQPKRLPITAGAVLAAILLCCGTTIGLDLLKGAVRTEADLTTLLPPKVKVLGTVPPIANKGDEQRVRLVTFEVGVVSLVACAALVVYFLKVRLIP
jgi:capsular polysaccharide biosynthesis protein